MAVIEKKIEAKSEKAMEKKNEEIDAYYRSIEEKRLRSGKFYCWNTKDGIFGAVNCKEIFEFFKKIELHKYKKFIDLGSGDGRVSIVASLFIDAVGVEIDDELIEMSLSAKKELKSDCVFLKQDFLTLDLSLYDFFFINPDKGFQRGLQQKLVDEMRKDAVLYIYNEIFAPESGFEKGKKEYCEMIPVVKYTKK